MEPFSVDKSFYDIAASDLRELWDSDLDPSMCELGVTEDEWSPSGLLAVKPQVILHDRLMTDAVLADTPIKTEHSYCSHSPPQSPLHGEGVYSTPLEAETTAYKDTDMEEDEDEDEEEEEYYVGAKNGNGRPPLSVVVVKAEPLSEPGSPVSSCPPSPPPVIFTGKSFGQSLLKQPTVLLTTKPPVVRRKHVVMQNIVKLESSTSGFSLPPTPPSSTSSDSEGNVSPLHPSSPSRRLFVSSTTSQPTRQPIQTPLISSQPKGSTGTLFLTEEEKRTLLAEGYPIPVRLPLTKTEEKSLKKIRRKIKNKISAQESRRKKKEYMDALERKVQILSSENSDFRKKITSLEDANSSLVNQLSKLQAVIARSHNGINIRNSHK